MAKAIELKGKVERITRSDGKSDAQVVISIPASAAADMPLGRVHLTVEPTTGPAPVQTKVDGKKAPGKPVRGDRG